MDPISIITSKIMGPIALVGCIALGVMFGVTRAELAGSRHHVETLQDAIENKTTGWRVKLATCQGNEATLKGQVDDQTAKVKATAAQMQAKLDTAAALAAKAQQGQAVANAKLTMLSSVPTTGDSCKDAAAIDAALLETLK